MRAWRCSQPRTSSAPSVGPARSRRALMELSRAANWWGQSCGIAAGIAAGPRVGLLAQVPTPQAAAPPAATGRAAAPVAVPAVSPPLRSLPPPPPLPLLAASCSVSCRPGRLGTAPMREVAMPPAALAKRRHSRKGRPSTSATAKAARKASPAAVASTTAAPGRPSASCLSTEPSGAASREPRGPSVTSTLRAPRRCRAAAAASTCASLAVGRPVSRASSDSLGHT